MKKKTMLFLAVAVSMFSACGQNLKDGADGSVIAVGERSVYPENISESFERYRGDSTSVYVLRDNIVARELFIAHAVDLGLQNDKEVVRLTHERSREILQSQWHSHFLDQVELGDEVVRDFWERMGTGVSYTSFYHEDSLLIDSVITMTRDGEHLSKFSGEIGMDEMMRQNRGQIQLSERNFANIMDLEHLIAAENGDIIGPFPAASGWRILQIDSIWTYTTEPFESDSLRLAPMLLARAREERKIFLEDSLKAAFDIQIDMDVLNLMAENSDAQGVMFGIFQPEEEDLVVVSWNGGSRTLYSVTENLVGLPSYFPKETGDVSWLADYARVLVLFDIQMEEAILLGLDTIPSVARMIDAKHWEAVLDKYYDTVISVRIVVDSVALNEVYLDIRDDYPIEETRVFHVLFLEDSDRVEVAEGIMASSGDILAAIDQFEIFPQILAEGEETITLPLKASMVPENDRDVLFNLIPGEETIITLSDSTSLWLRLDKINEEHIALFDDISGIVVSEIEQRLETEAIETLVDSLSGEFDLYIDEEYFEDFCISLEVDSISTANDSMEVI